MMLFKKAGRPSKLNADIIRLLVVKERTAGDIETALGVNIGTVRKSLERLNKTYPEVYAETVLAHKIYGIRRD